MRAPTKKGEKERKDKGKEKISDKMTEQKQCFIKLWETWKKMQAIGDIISNFFPYYFNCHTKKSTKIKLGENTVNDIFSPCVFIFPLLDMFSPCIYVFPLAMLYLPS
jgi:hypothetical protein